MSYLDKIRREQGKPRALGFYLHRDFPKQKFIYVTFVYVTDAEMLELFPCVKINEQTFFNILDQNEKSPGSDVINIIEVDDRVIQKDFQDSKIVVANGLGKKLHIPFRKTK